MLRISSVQYSDDDVYWTGTYAGIPNVLWVTNRKVRPALESYRNYGYLHQGGVMDRYGNKSVDNVKVDGDIIMTPRFARTVNDNGSNYPSRSYQTATPTVVRNGVVYVLLTGRDVITTYYESGVSVSVFQTVPLTVKNGDTVYGLIYAQGSYSKYTYTSGGRKIYTWGTPDYDYDAVKRNPGNSGWVTCGYAYPNKSSMSATSKTYRTYLTEPLGSMVFTSFRGTGEIEAMLISLMSYYMMGLRQQAVDAAKSRTWRRTAKLSTLFGENRGSEPLPNMDEYFSRMSGLYNSMAVFSAEELSYHARDCIEAYNDFSSNILAYAADIGKTGDTVREMFKLVGNIKSPKAWASAWLSYRYGDRLFISDTKELLESVSKRILTRRDRTLARARTTTAESVNGIQAERSRTSTLVAFNDSFNGIMTGINNLMRWDAWPTLANTWDLIPLSFVVDWFLPVNNLLDQIDAAVQAPYIKVETGYVGEKLTCRHSLSLPTMKGSWTYTRYQRYAHNPTHDIRPFDVEIAPPLFSVTHTGDALALITQLGSRHR